MTRYLCELQQPSDSTKSLIENLELLCSSGGHDIRLTTELQTKFRAVLSSLGMDAVDTTAPELYLALANRAAQDELKFLEELKLDISVKEDKFTEKLASHLSKKLKDKLVLVPKRTVLKKLLKKSPPKAALKMLHYRSFDSALRRCPLPVLLAACELTETLKWKTNFAKAIDTLDSNDFETRVVEFCSVKPQQWSGLQEALLSKSGHSVFRVNAAGGIVMVPASQKLLAGQATLFLCAVLSALGKLRAHASFTPRVLLDGSVPTKYSQHVYDQDNGTLVIRRVQISWPEVHHVMARTSQIRSLFEPYINKELLVNDRFGELLLAVSSSFKWWSELTALGYFSGGQVVSCNLYDVSRNLIFNRPFGRHTTIGMQRELDLSLRLKYLQDEKLNGLLFDMLSASSDFVPEPLMLELD